MEVNPAPSLAVIVPAYNEEAGIEGAIREIQEEILPLVPDAEVIVVNDGSRDGTGAVLDRLALGDNRLRIIHQPNGGHGSAVMTGLGAARSKWLFVMDSDRQIPLTAFDGIWRAAQQAGAAFGVRRTRQDPRIRLWLTAAIRPVLGVLFGVRLRDANVPFKLLKRELWDEASQFIPSGTLAPSLFLAVYLRKRGYSIAEIDVPHSPRETGKVSIRRLKLFTFCATALMQLVAFRRVISRSHNVTAVVTQLEAPVARDESVV